MNDQGLFIDKARAYLNELCVGIGERSVGCEGNRRATAFFRDELKALGWAVEAHEFSAVDWAGGGAALSAGGERFDVRSSPYSLGFSGKARLACASCVEELERGGFGGKILLLHGPIAAEQLMPKNFVFYNPEEHRRVVALLENSGALALVCATGRNSALAGGAYPFPLIEDGDFDVPSVYMTEEEGKRLLAHAGKEVSLESDAKRLPAAGYNVIGTKGAAGAKRIVVTAHIDAKKGTPGAIDNATGVAVLLLVAEFLKDYGGGRLVEIVAFNGEDYYAVPGQMDYIRRNDGRFGDMLLNINIDGAGMAGGKSLFSFGGLSDGLREAALAAAGAHPDIVEGEWWPQGDHSIFAQYGVPAIAVSSQWLIENMSSQDITHTLKDEPGIVDCAKLVEIAAAIGELIVKV